MIEVSKSRIRRSTRGVPGSRDSESSVPEDKQEAQEVDKLLAKANLGDISSDEEVPARISISQVAAASASEEEIEQSTQKLGPTQRSHPDVHQSGSQWSQVSPAGSGAGSHKGSDESSKD